LGLGQDAVGPGLEVVVLLGAVVVDGQRDQLGAAGALGVGGDGSRAAGGRRKGEGRARMRVRGGVSDGGWLHGTLGSYLRGEGSALLPLLLAQLPPLLAAGGAARIAGTAAAAAAPRCRCS
jgi:hypothetical protein